MSDSLILGGGISGLAAAGRLQSHGAPFKLIERNATLGGLSRSIYIERYIFDYTGHFVHLAQAGHPSELGRAPRPQPWQMIERRSYCYVAGVFTAAPFQYNLAQLPPEVRDHCLESFLAAPGQQEPEGEMPADLLSYFYRYFGEGITDYFLKPYNEKLFACDLRRLSVDSISRFFPLPHRDRILWGGRDSGGGQQGYNAKFWYPVMNGIQQLVDGLAVGLDHVVGEVLEIDLDDRVVFASGRPYRYDRVFSSIPLEVLLRAAGDSFPEAAGMADRLTYSSVISFQIGARGPLPADLDGRHWIYVPDPAIPFHRVGVYSNFNSVMAPEGCYNIYVEVGAADATTVAMADLERSVLEALERIGWLRRDKIEVLATHSIQHGYVHFNHDWKHIVPSVQERLRDLGVHSIGRYGTWNYISMEESIKGAEAVVDETLRRDRSTSVVVGPFAPPLEPDLGVERRL